MTQQQLANCFVRIYQNESELIVRLFFDESLFQSTQPVIRIEYYDDAARDCVRMIDRLNRKHSSVRLRLCGKHKKDRLSNKTITDIKDVGVIMYLTFVDKTVFEENCKSRKKKPSPRIKHVGFMTDRNATIEEIAECIKRDCV